MSCKVPTSTDYDPQLFSINAQTVNVADPFVFDNTERDGYYYLYGTKTKDLLCYKSKDLKNWEVAGAALWTMLNQNSDTNKANAIKDDVWAPEVIYDKTERLYYMFFSARPEADTANPESNQTSDVGTHYQLYVATSRCPEKDYQLVDFFDESSCGRGNVRTEYEPYNQYYARYSLLNPKEYNQYVTNGSGTGAVYANEIDAHPFVDDDGSKYMYWTDNTGDNSIWVVEMENWLKPRMYTAKRVLCTKYESLASDTKVDYENKDNPVVEGVTVVKHGSKYYMTFSVNDCREKDYQIGQAVADSPSDPFRKLSSKEGGLLLSAKASGNGAISGAGHHGFVSVGDHTYIVYHRHDDPIKGGHERHIAIDEVKWIKNKGDLEVMYVNGPTSTIQSALEPFSTYRNIAGEASVAGGTASLSPLTDGLLSINRYGDATFAECIPELKVTEKSTFTFSFDGARTVRAVMIYNSKNPDTSFDKISEIILVCESEGREVIYKVSNLEWKDTGVPGSAAIAQFDNDLYVKSVSFTIEVPQGKSSVGISEIKILGK